uniref:Nascent polypeptide-associated complex subunit beta n=1 Tax=Vannella robusta TaxID=1487602 RepID=A0A7S4M4V3_9EUKA
MNQERLNRMQNSVRIGGKGSVRRKKKTVHKKTNASDQKLNLVLKKLGMNQMPGIEEVNLFHRDGTVTHFQQPKVQFSAPANTYVVGGNAERKQLQELLPNIINQLGPDALANLKKIADTFQAQGGLDGVPDLADDDDVPELAADDVPELVDEQPAE